jgi:hypothetical protein
MPNGIHAADVFFFIAWLQIPVGLNMHPELRRRLETMSQAKCRIRGHASLAEEAPRLSISHGS